MNPEIVLSTVVVFAGFIITLRTVTHFLLERTKLRTGQPQTSIDSGRLERIEQAVDAIAIEVERISEGQRFTSRLLADRAPAAEARSELGAPRPGGMAPR